MIKTSFIVLLTIGLVIYFVRAIDSRTMMRLYVEHQVELESEYRTGAEIDWAGYKALEQALSVELEDDLRGRLRTHAAKCSANFDVWFG